jgi:predicted phage terminase large subunit-like protein
MSMTPEQNCRLSWETLTQEQRQTALASLTEEEADALIHDWTLIGRDKQQPPEGDWSYWLYLGGRGAGKTRAGSEWVRSKIKSGCHWIGLVAPTAADSRSVLIEGESGILATAWKHDRDYKGNLIGVPVYEPSRRKLTWINGASATLFSAEEPDRLRGPQHEAIWFDELAAYPNAQHVWDMALFGLRLGRNPQALITTTPRPIPIIRELLKDEHCRLTHESTFANQANLAKSFYSNITKKYQGTSLGRQELMAEVIDAAEGALWTREMIKQPDSVPEFSRVLIGVDPAMTAHAESALTGIVVVALGKDGNGYVLDDCSGRMSPDGWARRVANAFQDYGADRIIAEGNQGGELVSHTIKTANPNLPVKMVHASRGKMARAEPVAALYEQGRITHVRQFPELEDQMCTWEPLGQMGSPDRLDALVWAITELMVSGPKPIDISQDIGIYVGSPLAAARVEYW